MEGYKVLNLGLDRGFNRRGKTFEEGYAPS